MSFRDILQKSIDEVNKGALRDRALKDAFKEYDGKRVILDIVRDTTYAITISSGEISLTMDAVANSEDMYVWIDRETAQEFVSQNISPLQLPSIVLSGKIKIKNIGTREINLVRRLYRGF